MLEGAVAAVTLVVEVPVGNLPVIVLDLLVLRGLLVEADRLACSTPLSVAVAALTAADARRRGFVCNVKEMLFNYLITYSSMLVR